MNTIAFIINKKRTMERKEFLSLIGIGTASIVFSSCFEGCSPEDQVAAPPSNIDFTLDLTNSAYSSLNTDGGYIYKSGLIVARTLSGLYVAVSAACTHEGTNVKFEGSNNRFHCPTHNSNFSTSGTVLSGPANKSLKQYHTSLNGTSLRVYS